MRKILLFSICFLHLSLSQAFGVSLENLGKDLNIQLQEAEYGEGTVQTDKGGIIKGKDLFLQARKIVYTRFGAGDDFVHKVEAEDQLFVKYKGRSYAGDRVEFDAVNSTLTVWNGRTQFDHWFVGGNKVEVFSDGRIVISDAYVTTSENERDDWTLRAESATVSKDSHLKASNVRFYFVHMPLFWVPSFSSDMVDIDGAPFHYRVRSGGREGTRVGISYRFTTDRWKHRALVDYSIKNGFGTGLRSRYESKERLTHFDAYNYIAQGEKKKWDSARHRIQGLFRTYCDTANINVRAQYDKLSDKRMKYDYSDRAVSDVRAGVTQLNFWREEPDWKAKLDASVRLNTFQNIKQKLPLFSYNRRSQSLGTTPFILSTKFSAGFLDYVYAKRTPAVHDFHSTRTQLSQRLSLTRNLSFLSITPSLSYSLVHYNNSPQDNSKFQAVGIAAIGVKSRFIRGGTATTQILEPYVDFSALSRPTVRADRNYIFGLEDGWARINTLRYGVRHNLYLSPREDGFRPKIRSDLYSRSFYATRHLPRDPYKVWFASTWDATSRGSYKLETAWNVRHNQLDHLNVQMRHTFSDRLACILEWRQRSRYSWRKLDKENFIVEAVRSPNRLRRSQMSDRRKTLRASVAWSPIPTFDVDFVSWLGWRRTSPKRYINYEVNVTTLLRGALRVMLSLQWRPGGRGNGWHLSCSLGSKSHSSSTSCKKIGQGAYDLW